MDYHEQIRGDRNHHINRRGRTKVMEIDLLKSVINGSSELSKQGQNEKALRLLDDSIAEAIRTNRSMWIRVLSRHAAAISDSMGDLRFLTIRWRCTAWPTRCFRRAKRT